MVQPTISHFFKSSQPKSASSSQSFGNITQQDAKHSSGLGSQAPQGTTDMNEKELINILGSDSESDSDFQIVDLEVSPDQGSNSNSNVSSNSNSNVESDGGILTVSGLERQADFNEKLKVIMKRRYAGSMLSTGSDAENDDNDDESNGKAVKKLKANKKLTELDQQFKDLKLKHLDTILCVRVGYKYKFFERDAEIVSNILQIKLVPGKKTLDDSDPDDRNYRKFQYCSIPDTRLHVHLQRLVFFNYKVAVVEQTETSALKKNNHSGSLFTREIKNIFTKVSYGINETFNKNEEHILGDLTSIWAISVHETSKFRKITLISVQLNSGDIVYDQFNDDNLLNVNLEARIRHLNPTEIITEEELPQTVKRIFSKLNRDIQFYQSHKEDCSNLYDALQSLNLNNDLKRLISVLHSYLSTFENTKVLYFASNYSSFTSKKYMILPSNSIESLEIFENSTTHKTLGSLLWVMDHTRTQFGFRLLRNWISKPLIDIESINDRLHAVSCIMKEVQGIFFEALNELLKKSIDLERALNRIAYGSTSRKEVYFFLKQIATFSSHFKSHHVFLQAQLQNENSSVRQSSALLHSILANLDVFFTNTELPAFLQMINADAALDKDLHKSVVEFFNLNTYDSPEALLQKYRDIEEVKTELEDELVNIKRILKKPTLKYKDTKDYLIEVRNTQTKIIPPDWVKINSTKAVSRFRTPKTEQLVNKLQYHNDLLDILAEDEFKRFLQRIIDCYPQIKTCINNLATYDCILSLAATSSNVGYIKPKFVETEQTLKVKNGRNPIIESLDVNYVPNDILMSATNSKVNIITGPNMGGKSSYIRQVALLVVMAQIGCYIPAESAEFSICDRIFTRIGSHDDLMRGQSTFQVEMSEVLHILNSATPRSLLLLDEVGRGTGTHDGLSISFALLHYFVDLNKDCPLVLFITHYTSLCQISSPLIANYHMSYIEKHHPGEKWTNVIFLYKLVQGQAHNSYGFNVAKLSAIPTNIINRAFEVSEEKISSSSDSTFLEAMQTLKTVNARNLTKGTLTRIKTFCEDI
ncbi:unnamed protein product [Kluyveromyces dobzhanskii CBS 2104]|uniref:DNA mismatch repair protein MSH3 n=1 Tax=Kluyveromyces dobzhanskii CBS 2104 TaxID=1427455 RepID=A0A0A8L2W3_9SACH|nr:unnamed protein product [Kluyveromyces dobzhanskii CBS 2104]